MKPGLTIESVLELLDYDSATGIFEWRRSMNGNAVVGRRAGAIDKNGYVRIRVCGVRMLAHRLVWLCATGSLPRAQVDHINGRRDDNRFCNLRDVDAATNQENRHRPQGANQYLWVTWKARENRWRGTFRVRGTDVTVGSFSKPLTAYRAVLARRASMGIGQDGAPTQPAPAGVAA